MSLRRLPPISVGPCKPRTPSTRQSRRFHFFTARRDLVRTWRKVLRQRQPTFTLISPHPRLRLLRHTRWFRLCPTAMSSLWQGTSPTNWLLPHSYSPAPGALPHLS